MTTYVDQDVTCPNCANTVKVHMLMSTNTLGPRFTDFRQDAGGFQPRMLVMNLCPHCGYAGYSNEFTPEYALPEAVAALLAAEIYPDVAGKHVPVSGIYEIYARLAEWLGKPPLQVADSYLKAAWCCQDEGDTARELDYRRAAIDFFRQGLDDGSVAVDIVPNLTYLVGELYRRVGEPELAWEWFSHVIEQAKTDPTWQGIAPLAVQQRDNPSDQLR